MPFWVSIENTRGEVERVRVDADVIRFGRGTENDVVLQTPLASREHCRVFTSAGRLMIEDLGSENGTYLLEERVVGARELFPGAKVSVPGFSFSLEAQDEPHPTTARIHVGRSSFGLANNDSEDAQDGASMSDDEQSLERHAQRQTAPRGFSPLVSYGGGAEAEELARQAEEAFAHKDTLAMARPPVKGESLADGDDATSPFMGTFGAQTEGAATEAMSTTMLPTEEVETQHAATESREVSSSETTDAPSLAISSADGSSADSGPMGRGFGPFGPKTDPTGHRTASASSRISSQAGVPIDAREIRANLFQLFLRAVKRSPPAIGRKGRADLRRQLAAAIPSDDERLTHLETQTWAAEMVEELCGYGPLTPLLANPNVTSVVVEGVDRIRIQRGGSLVPVGSAFTSLEAMEAVAERLVEEAGGALPDVNKTLTYRLPSGLEIIRHTRHDDNAPFTVVKPRGNVATELEQRLHLRAQEVEAASLGRDDG